jgi:ABC-type dipeptide/oligopeptide/nickel transport system permease subunit
MKGLAFNIGTALGSPLGSGKYTIGNLISTVIGIFFALAGIILIFYFILGGIQIIAGAGSEKPEAIEKGKKAATSALIGFVIIIVAYWIIRIIELITGVTFVTAPTF